MASSKKSLKKYYGFESPIRLNAQQRHEKRRILSRTVSQIVPKKNMRASALVSAMADMSVQARNLGTAARALKGMYTDRTRQTILLGLAGPLIAAGLREVILKLIKGGYVDVLVSTGAILYQDIYQALGYQHYKGSSAAHDVTLCDLRINRIYDTYVDDEAFWIVDTWCAKAADEMKPGNYSSRAYLDFLGARLDDSHSIVRECHRLGIPMFCPALNDSSIGIGLTEHRHRCIQEGTKGICIDSISDNYELTQIVAQSPATSAFYVAGGVPKNYINDSVIMSYIFKENRGHSYAVQITTAIVEDGGLSGSTLGEAQSWGKIDRKARFAKAWVEPSVSLPLLATYIIDECPDWRSRGRLSFDWDDSTLKSIKTLKGK